jgi:hypothetical protein
MRSAKGNRLSTRGYFKKTEISGIFLSSANFTYETEQKKQDDVHTDNTGAHGDRQEIGQDDSRNQPYDRYASRTDHHALEAFVHAHGRKSGEDDQTGDEQRAHQSHPENNRDSRQHRQQAVVEARPDAGGPDKGLVKCNGKYFPIGNNVYRKHHCGKYQTEPDIRGFHGQNASEHVVHQVHISVGSGGNEHDAYGQSAGRDYGNGRIAFDFRRITESE